MPKLSPDCLDAVREALSDYIEDVNSTLLTNSTKETYTYHANNFVRWLYDDFVPGESKEQARARVIAALEIQRGEGLTDEEKDEVRRLPGNRRG